MMINRMSIIIKSLIIVYAFVVASWAENSDSEEIYNIGENNGIPIKPTLNVDTMNRVNPTFITETGKIIGTVVTTAGVVSHYGGYPVVGYGIREHDKNLIIGGMAAVVLGIPLAGIGSEISVNSAFSDTDARAINKSNWDLYKSGQLLTYGGMALSILGVVMLNDIDYENDDNDYAVAGVFFVVIGPIGTIIGLVQNEASIFSFSKSVIDSYKSKRRIDLNANIVMINVSKDKWLPGIQSTIRF